MAEFVLEYKKSVSVIMDCDTFPGVKRVWKKVEEDILQTTGAECVTKGASDGLQFDSDGCESEQEGSYGIVVGTVRGE